MHLANAAKVLFEAMELNPSLYDIITSEGILDPNKDLDVAYGIGLAEV